MKTQRNSKLSGFYKLPIEERRALVDSWVGEKADFDADLLLSSADGMIENVIGRYSLPFALAPNFRINDIDYLIPMVVEEASVVAAVSNAAKLFRLGGGLTASADDPVMIGQLQLLDIHDASVIRERIEGHKSKLLEAANNVGGSIVKRGGGAKGIEIRVFEETSMGPMVILHLLFDTRDAMGANAINSALELMAPLVEEVTGARVHLKILSNLADQRKAYAEGVIPCSCFAHSHYEEAGDTIDRIMEAAVMAEVDPYRATTHNKGIMNGIDAVAIATGNDWRSIEAGAHAYAARRGSYTSLTRWRKTEDGDLHGSIELPLAVGIVGGATRVHPQAQLALRILDVESAQELAGIMAAVGLAQNFAAMRALATDGIQNGHMRMHARQLAIAAGATSSQIQQIAGQMIQEKNIRLERAQELMQALNTREETSHDG